MLGASVAAGQIGQVRAAQGYAGLLATREAVGELATQDLAVVMQRAVPWWSVGSGSSPRLWLRDCQGSAGTAGGKRNALAGNGIPWAGAEIDLTIVIEQKDQCWSDTAFPVCLGFATNLQGERLP